MSLGLQCFVAAGQHQAGERAQCLNMILLIGIYAPRRPFSYLWSHGAESLLGDFFPLRGPLAQARALQFMCDNASVELLSLSKPPCDVMAQGTQLLDMAAAGEEGRCEDSYRIEVQMVADESSAFRERIGYVLHEGREGCGQWYTLGVCFFVRDMMALFNGLRALMIRF
jgi:hypothetical protein